MPPVKILKPRKGESKQSFLKRCLAARKAEGVAEDRAMGSCAEAWNQERMVAYMDDSRMDLDATVHLEALEANAAGDAPRRFSILAYTGKVIDRLWGKFVIDLSGMRLAKDAVPCLYAHDSFQIVGTVDKSTTDKTGFSVFGNFSQVTAAAQEVLGLADEGFPWQASIGVQGIKVLELAEGQNRKVNGQTVTGPIDVWLESEVRETSFLPFGADDQTAAVSLSAGGENNTEEVQMNPKLRMLLERLGLPATATEQEALAFMAKLEPEQLAAVQSEAGDKPAAEGTAPAPGQAAGQGQDSLAGVADDPGHVELSAGDLLNLQVHASQLGLGPADFQATLGDCKLTRDQAASKLLAAAAAKNKPVGAGAHLDMGADELDKYRAAARDGQLLRAGKPVEKPAPGHEIFRGMSLCDLARDCLERRGVSARGLSRNSLAEAILGKKGIVRNEALAAMSTSDFSSIFLDVAHATLQRAYTETPRTWLPLVNTVDASDFKEIYGVSLSEAPNLQLIGENGEYKEGTFADNQESFCVRSYGLVVYLTRKMIVNDSLRAFTRLPQLFGASGARKESDIVWAIITGNAVMKDGKGIFHADHKNLEATATYLAAPSRTTLDRARQVMRAQTGLKGATLDIQPRYVLVPTIMQTLAEILLLSATLPEANMPAGVPNPFQRAGILPISDPRLDAVDPDAWYMAGDPNQVDIIDVAWLDGQQVPRVREENVFGRDAMGYEITHDFGAGAADHRGIYKNPGKAAA